MRMQYLNIQISVEEAIEILKQRECCRECVVNGMDCDKCDKAFEMAIAALKAEPCEDAVSREAVISLAKDIVIGDYRHRCIDPQSVMELPPVTPKQRTGKIIMGGYDCDHYVCSECGHDFGWYSKPNHKYCPNCGAKMEGENK